MPQKKDRSSLWADKECLYQGFSSYFKAQEGRSTHLLDRVKVCPCRDVMLKSLKCLRAPNRYGLLTHISNKTTLRFGEEAAYWCCQAISPCPCNSAR